MRFMTVSALKLQFCRLCSLEYPDADFAAFRNQYVSIPSGERCGVYLAD